jgi:hypothetical protein
MGMIAIKWSQSIGFNQVVTTVPNIHNQIIQDFLPYIFSFAALEVNQSGPLAANSVRTSKSPGNG